MGEEGNGRQGTGRWTEYNERRGERPDMEGGGKRLVWQVDRGGKKGRGSRDFAEGKLRGVQVARSGGRYIGVRSFLYLIPL